ncbi:unnamed protein product [Prorocentrum cordatum]|uniref:Uncharacterized protein n=1 Tax=Prorocentrum cordatum TaxID=2364126 RepID=A0ABN9RIX9_9DINO|nr:unnamed protein product [Polarella glacialis]
MAPARRPRGGALVAVGALLLLRLRPAAAAPPVDDTLAGMLGKIKSDPALLQERHESHGHVLLGEPKSQKEASAACMLDSAAAIIRANGVKGIVNGLQFDLAACCRKDEFACREDVGEAYGLLTQLRHGRTSGAERPARPSRRTRPRSCSGPPGEARRHPAGAAALREVPELLLGGPDGVHHAGAQGRRLSIEPRFTGAVRWRAGRATHSGDLCFPCRCCPAVPRSRWAPAGPSRGVLGTVDSLGGNKIHAKFTSFFTRRFGAWHWQNATRKSAAARLARSVQ